ncbi:MAG: 3'(2'),5'-bisphosphate nucleotidase CysQ [Alphaproteobacteria bacterium]
MYDKNKLKKLAADLLPAIFQAGEVIMEVYQRPEIDIKTKQNTSPVTEADERAEVVLLAALSEIMPGIPVVAEEQAEAEGLPAGGGEEFFLVDPLDGTKEFIKKATSFTVNVALIQAGEPVFGIVYAPALGELFIGLGPGQAFKIEGQGGERVPISVRKATEKLALVASKSHRNPETENYLANYPEAEIVSIGSSLKFCLVAEGKADLYPRFGPTMEWDTAAGHAVLSSAGGAVFNPDGSLFSYDKPGFKIGFFIARGESSINFVKD